MQIIHHSLSCWRSNRLTVIDGSTFPPSVQMTTSPSPWKAEESTPPSSSPTLAPSTVSFTSSTASSVYPPWPSSRNSSKIPLWGKINWNIPFEMKQSISQLLLNCYAAKHTRWPSKMISSGGCKPTEIRTTLESSKSSPCWSPVTRPGKLSIARWARLSRSSLWENILTTWVILFKSSKGVLEDVIDVWHFHFIFPGAPNLGTPFGRRSRIEHQQPDEPGAWQLPANDPRQSEDRLRRKRRR